MAAPTKPFAWQPLTPRGVAAFAHALTGRLLLVALIVALFAAGAMDWFLSARWFPAVRQAVHRLPEQGVIRGQILDSPITSAEILAESRFLMFVLDLEKQRNATQNSDVLVEFHKKNFQICSIFGCLFFNYPKSWNGDFNRGKLVPLWDAWEPVLLGLVPFCIIVFLFMSWAALSALYSLLVRLLGFFKDRDLDWRSSWRLASAALMPGALLLGAGIFCYGFGVVDLIRLLLLFVLHFMLGWVYLAVSPLFVPRLADVLPRGVNPFTTSTSEPKSGSD